MTLDAPPGLIHPPIPVDEAVVGIGLDLVDVLRFRRSLERTPSMRVRLFTPGELAYAESANDPVLRLAARFAMKESVMKALGVGLGAFGFHDAEVIRAESGAPSVLLRGSAERLAMSAGVTGWHLSLSHTETNAAAIVVATRRSAP